MMQRPDFDARVLAFARACEFSRADFPQAGVYTFRLSRKVTQAMLGEVMLPQEAIDGATEWAMHLIVSVA